MLAIYYLCTCFGRVKDRYCFCIPSPISREKTIVSQCRDPCRYFVKLLVRHKAALMSGQSVCFTHYDGVHLVPFSPDLYAPQYDLTLFVAISSIPVKTLGMVVTPPDFTSFEVMEEPTDLNRAHLLRHIQKAMLSQHLSAPPVMPQLNQHMKCVLARRGDAQSGDLVYPLPCQDLLPLATMEVCSVVLYHQSAEKQGALLLKQVMAIPMKEWPDIHNDDELHLDMTVAALEVGDSCKGRQLPANMFEKVTYLHELFVDLLCHAGTQDLFKSQTSLVLICVGEMTNLDHPHVHPVMVPVPFTIEAVDCSTPFPSHIDLEFWRWIFMMFVL